MRRSTRLYYLAAIAVVAVIVFMIATSHGPEASSSRTKLQVIAAENFWGSLVAQLGGNRVNVVSIVSDPNADPHEYESNATDAREFAKANYVILNGVGYDDWGNKLLSAQPSSSRKVLNVGNLVGVQEGSNPHLWYNPNYVNAAVDQMAKDLIALDPSNQTYYHQQLIKLDTSLSVYQDRLKNIKQQFGGTKVAATEDIFAYLASAAGLDLISPPAFTEAVAEGNDPPTSSVVAFQQQLESSQVKVLAYNDQTVTPLTSSMKLLAAQNNIPIIGITETIQPPDTSFQDWMNAELINLENALNANTLGQ